MADLDGDGLLDGYVFGNKLNRTSFTYRLVIESLYNAGRATDPSAKFEVRSLAGVSLVTVTENL